MKVLTEYKYFGENLSSLENTKCKMNISYWPLFSIREKETRTKWHYEKGENLTLAAGWEDSEFFPAGLILKLLLAWETFN